MWGTREEIDFSEEMENCDWFNDEFKSYKEYLEYEIVECTDTGMDVCNCVDQFFDVYTVVSRHISQAESGKKLLYRGLSNVNYDAVKFNIEHNPKYKLGSSWSWSENTAKYFASLSNRFASDPDKKDSVIIQGRLPDGIDRDETLVANFDAVMGEEEIKLLPYSEIEIVAICRVEKGKLDCEPFISKGII